VTVPWHSRRLVSVVLAVLPRDEVDVGFSDDLSVPAVPARLITRWFLWRGMRHEGAPDPPWDSQGASAVDSGPRCVVWFRVSSCRRNGEKFLFLWLV
jgi:hypothetical protein